MSKFVRKKKEKVIKKIRSKQSNLDYIKSSI